MAQLQVKNEVNGQLLSHSQELSEDPSEAPYMEQDCWFDDKQKLNHDDNMKIEEGIKQQKTDESPISKSIVVLDSDDSEDEGNVSSRSKSLLA